MHLLGKVIHQDNKKVIEVIHKLHSKEYKIHNMQRQCTYCKKTVHKDSGKMVMDSRVAKLSTPKFFCHKHYVAVIKILKTLK